MGYSIAQNATTGPWDISIENRFGTGTATQTFNVGDPPPNILSVSPGVWQAGTSPMITISGTGFGTSPTVSMSGTGVSLVSVCTTSDTVITASVSIASNAPNQTATVTVQSGGYYGSGFVSTYPGEPSNNSYNVPVDSTPAPVPQIQLYGQTITTTQSLTAGQEIALSAVVSLQMGQSICSQSWSTPPGTAIGGYTISSSAGTVNLLPTLSSNTCTSNPLAITFYWLDGDANASRQITYTFTMTNGQSNSATAVFDIAAPTGTSVSAMPVPPPLPPVTILNPPLNPGPSQYNNPVLIDGASNFSGQNFMATGTSFPPGNNGQYQWVQLISQDKTKNLSSVGPSAVFDAINGNAWLDVEYPHGAHCLGQPVCTVTTTFVTYDSANDSPLVTLLSGYGEFARSFDATMYLMWIPNADSRCTGMGCTVPVPLGSVSWLYEGDAVNTLTIQQNQGLTFPLWVLAAGQASPGQFQAGGSLPQWQNVYNPIP